jgi:hypothetical protein
MKNILAAHLICATLSSVPIQAQGTDAANAGVVSPTRFAVDDEDEAAYVIAQAAQSQPGAAQPRSTPDAPRSTAPRRSGGSPFTSTPNSFAALNASPRSRLASTPDMFGDFFARGGTLVATDRLGTAAPFGITSLADIPLAGGVRGLKIGENNRALPTDRAYLNYNHYHNAVRVRASGVNPTPLPGAPFAPSRDLSLDHFTLGGEKSFWCGTTSLELRMPFSGGYDFDFGSGDPNGIVTVDGGSVGNLSVIAKALLYADDQTAIAAGLGIETPTGDDTTLRVAFTNYRIESEAFHLSPYLAVQNAYDDILFSNAFLQVDLPLGGNSFSFTSAGGLPDAGTLGVYDEQALLHVDLSLGAWLHRDPCASFVTGVASVIEVHYITALEDTDVVAGGRATPIAPPGATFDLRNRLNRFDVVHLTTGLHTEIAEDSSLRVGLVLPLRSGESRFFDAEVLAQLTRRF